MQKKFLALAFMLVTLIFVGEAEAGIVTDRLPFQCYVDHQVDTYSQPNGQRVGYISPNVDLVQVTQVRGDGWAYGSYPGKSGRVARWFRISDICADTNYSNRPAKSKGAQRVFRTRSVNDIIGSVSNLEDVIVLADNGTRAQIIYKLNNGTGYKIGWVFSSTLIYQVPVLKKGDVNGDGKIDQSDVELMRKYMVGTVPESQINKANADMNGDGKVDIADFAMLTDKLDGQTQTGHNPEGTVQIAESTQPNTLHVRGTAFDQDNPSGSTRLHVYIGGGAGSGAPSYEIRTNGSNRVFDDTRQVSRTGNQPVHIYALNDYGSGDNVEIWKGNVYIKTNGGGEFAWPVPGYYKINTTYTYSSGKIHSSRYKYNGRACGIDISVPVGTEVRAVADGVIVNQINRGSESFGKWLEIRHDDGTCSVYAHLSDYSMVRQGQRVSKGDLIARSGNTGNSTGPHLHFELSGHDTYQYFKNLGVIK